MHGIYYPVIGFLSGFASWWFDRSRRCFPDAILFFIALFVFLVYRGFKIARNAPDVLAKLTALGISSWLAIQVLINIGGMLQVMPLTGVPLSFISLGGSNLVVTLAAVGIMTNISKFSSYEA